MIYIKNTLDYELNNTVVTIGKFDCFHLGHKLLIERANEFKSQGLSLGILTFDANPNDVINHKTERRIISSSERDFHAKRLGVDYFIEFPFDGKTKNMSAETFISEVLVKKLGCRAVVCGDDFRFGKDRLGDTELLKKIGKEQGFSVEVVERLKYEGVVISSAYIRSQLSEGNLQVVNNMLGRPYCMAGKVIHGTNIGSGMDFPTINFSIPEDKLLPPDGVYATKTRFGDKSFLSVTNVGKRPTFFIDGTKYVETNILDFNEEVYGKVAAVDFYEFMRPEIRFPDQETLKKQIKSDTDQARHLLGRI